MNNKIKLIVTDDASEFTQENQNHPSNGWFALGL